jgi:hypothetical protein
MAHWWRHTLIAIAGLAAAFPLRVQLDLGQGSSLPIMDGSALAKGDGGGNGNGGGNGGGQSNGGGNGNSGGNGNGGGNAGGGNGGGSAGGAVNGNSGSNGNSDGGGRGGGNGNASGNGNGGGKGNGGGNSGASAGGAGNGSGGSNGNSNGGGVGNSGGNGNSGGGKGNGGGNGNSSAGGQGNGGGNGNAGGNGNGGGKSGGAGNGNGGSKGNSNAGDLGGGIGGGAGHGNSGGNGNGGGLGRGNSAGLGGAAAGKGNNNTGGNSSKANSGNNGTSNSSKGTSAGAGPSASTGNPKTSAPRAGTAPSGKSQRANDKKAQASTGTASASRSKATASAPQTPSRAKAAAQVQAAKTAASIKAQPARAVPVVDEIDRRPKPRQSSRSIVASGLSQADLARLTAQGFRIETRTQGSLTAPVVRLQVPAGVSVAQARQRVRLVDAQASVDFDQFYYLDEGTPACTGAACQSTPLADWASLVKWSGSNASQCGPAPLIGVIDTGINVEHAALKGQAIEVVAQPTRRAIASLPDHGTAVAALLVGRRDSPTPGLVPDARLVAVDAFYRDGGTADRTDVTSLVTAIEALAERGVRVINLSLSGPANEVLQKAIAAAQAKGIVIVAAAGNNGAGATPSYPAAYPGVVAVTAVDHELNVYQRATRGPYVDLAAPGVNVWTASAQGSGVLKSGTSYGVPFVSAAAGLLLSSHPELDMKAVQARLEESTLDLGQPGRDPTFGFGLIQMASLCAGPAEPPAITTAHEPPLAAPLGQQAVGRP